MLKRLSLLSLCLLTPALVMAEPAGDAAKFAGARTKVVWTRSIAWKDEDLYFQPKADLICLDTADGKERVLLPGDDTGAAPGKPAAITAKIPGDPSAPVAGKDGDVVLEDAAAASGGKSATSAAPRRPGQGCHYRPTITPDGTAVVYNEMTSSEVSSSLIRVVDWDGTNDRELGKGFALCTWRDPQSLAIWVYAAENCTGKNYNHGMGQGTLIRFRLDDPQARETLFKRMPVATAPFSVSADGTRAGGAFPWSNLGVAVLPDKGWQWYGSGYGGLLAPDNSYRYMHIGFPHTRQQEINTGGVNMYDDGGANRRAIRFHGGAARSVRWSNDVRFFTEYFGPAIWLGRFNERFDAVEAWVKVNKEDGPLIDPYAWIDPGLGRFDGEAPLTVAFLPPPSGGEWSWDLGDGSPAQTPGENQDKTARRATHHYTKSGTYTVTARHGKTVITGFVNVDPHLMPAATATAQLDAMHVWVAFNKRVKLDGAKIALTAGPAVKSAELNAESTELLITLAEPMSKTVTVSLAGVTDTTESAMRLAQPAVTVAHRAWPVNPDRLCYRFTNGRDTNVFWRTETVLYDATTNPLVQRLELEPRGNVAFDRDGVMEFAGGWFDNVLARYYTLGYVMLQAQELTLEATVQAADLKQGVPGRAAAILSLQGFPALTQEGATLRLSFRTQSTTPEAKGKMPPAVDNNVVLGVLPDARPHHLLVSYKPGLLVCYLDGNVLSTTDTITGELERQRIDPTCTIPSNPLRYFSLGYGPHFDTTWPWRGRLENVAVYSRFIEGGEAAQNAAVCLKAVAARPLVTPAIVEATLSAASKPAVDAPKARTGALIVNEYTMDKVVSGTCAAKTFRVLHWGWRRYWADWGSPKAPEPLCALPITALQPQSKITLALDPKTAHPELAGVLTVDTLPPAPDVPVFVENELAGLTIAPERFAPLLDLLGVKPDVAPGIPTENTSLRSLPAPGKVVIDGKTDDWDLSGGIFVCGDVEQRRDRQSAWIHVMHDANNLYLLARWRDETPMNNPKDTRTDKDGYNGDSLQFRLLAEPNTPQERCVHLTCWRGNDNQDAVEIVYGRKFDRECSKEEREMDNSSQAFARRADGKGYVQEIAIPWTLLTSGAKQPAVAMATVEINFTSPSGRVSTCDLLKAGSVSAGVTGFNNVDKWGALTFEAKRPVAPQPVRLADGRTFPVAAVPGELNVEWKGLAK